MNRRLSEIVGYLPEELLSKTFQDITHPDDLEADLQQLKRTLAGEIHGYTMEKRYFHRDGHTIWIKLTVSLVRHADGQPDYFISVVEDISEQHRLAVARQQAAAVFESTREGIIITDLQRRIQTVNPAFSDITGYSAEEAIGKTPAMLRSGHMSEELYQGMWESLHVLGHWQGEVLNRRKNGELFPELLTISTVRDPAGQPTQYVALLTDLSRLRQSEAQLAHLAHYDPLTDLPNRLLVQSRLDHALDTAQRENGRLAVLFIDLDRFKDVNDSLGHPVGDELLVAIAQRMRARLRESDTLARLGGDEFLVVLEDIHRPEDAAEVAQGLIRLQDAPIRLPSGHEVYVGVSIGISLYPNDGDSTTELIRQADAAMYQAKSQGRNTFRFYTAALTEAADQRLAMEGRLRRALQAGEFVVHYQPQFVAATGEVVGCEALVRWQDPDGGLVPPANFIPLAEDTGLIVPLGRWVLETACAQAQAWREAGVADLVMAVN
ncbi:MAG TPA: diguanylate cyclase, partial [Denitromonas sp.]|nr:diguanylate cyclase [Denitromonas sp.]